MHDRGAVLLPPPLEVTDVDEPDSTSSNATLVPPVPVMDGMSPRLQAHFLALMPNASTLSTTSVIVQGRNKRAIAQETARLAMEEIAAMERAVEILEQCVVAGTRQEAFVHVPLADTSDISDNDNDEEVDDDDDDDDDESKYVSSFGEVPITTDVRIRMDELNKRRRI
jgi:hypothetical protein